MEANTRNTRDAITSGSFFYGDLLREHKKVLY